MEQFYQDTRRKDGRQSWCKECIHKNNEKVRPHLGSRVHELRAAKLGRQTDPGINTDAVYEKFGGVCQICKENTTRGEAVLMHVVSLKEGGHHTWDNVILAHRSCCGRESLKRRKGFEAANNTKKGQKWCPKCKQWKYKTQFAIRSASPDGRQRLCKLCMKEVNKELYRRRQHA